MRLSRLIQKAKKTLRRAQIPAHAAGAAFFLVLSLLPLTTLLLAVLQYTVFRPEDVLALLSRIAPDEVLPLFARFLLRSYQTSGAAVISVSAIAAAWSASKGIYGMARGLNAVLELPETRGYMRVRLLCLGHMLLFVLGLVLTLLLHVFGQKLLSVLTEKGLPIARLASFLLELFCVLYLALPNRRQKLPAVFPGALCAAAAWLAFSALFSLYVSRFARSFALYGSLAVMVLTMLWVYICVEIVFYGALLNRLIAK